MTQLQMAQHKNQLGVLQAQGQLNKQIHIALKAFRNRVTQTLQNDQQHSSVNKYNTFKHGPEKVFAFRESLLSLMFRIRDFKTLYNMVIASFLILTFTLIFSNYETHGEVLDHDELENMFKGFTQIVLHLVVLVAIHFTIILIVKIGLKTSKWVYLPLYIAHLFLLMGSAMWFCSSNQDLGFACVLIVMIEATRMMMKSHSYFRNKMLYLTDNQYKNYKVKDCIASTTPRSKSSGNSISQKQQQSKHIFVQIQNNDVFTQFKNLCYFFVAPTIIYRDRYTLTPLRSMSKIIINGLNFMACIYYCTIYLFIFLAFMLYVFCCKKPIADLENSLTWSTFLLTVIKLMLPSTFFLILGFFGFLHSWLNCWAEITRFPDRCFYSDWWNSIQFGSYYRKWNIIVHDWLYYYIYLDTCRFTSNAKMPMVVPKLMTFIISAMIHELIITYTLGFFYPILFILFTGPGIILIQNQRRMKTISVNFAFWLEMYIGSSLLFTFYLIQSFARKRISDEFIEAEWGMAASPFIPRTLYLGQSHIIN